jgi:hypothetical protein
MPKKLKPMIKVNSPKKEGSTWQSSSRKMMLWPMRGMKATRKMSFLRYMRVRILLLRAEVSTKWRGAYWPR